MKESKKRKRDSLSQPIQTEPPSLATNSSSPIQNRTSVENQSPTDASPLLSSTMPYSQPAHEFTTSRILTPTDSPIIRSMWSCLILLIFLNLFYTVSSETTKSFYADSDCARSPTTAHRRSITTETDHMLTSDNLNELSKRNSQERSTSPKRIDLRKVTFGDAKLRPFAKSQRRRVSLPTHTSYPGNEEQRLPQPSQPSIHDSGWLFNLEGYLVVSMLVQTDFDILSFSETLTSSRNDDPPPDRSAQANSAAMFREPFVYNSGLPVLPVRSFSIDLSDITGGSFVTKPLHHASLASTNSGLPAEAAQRNHINNRLPLDIALAQLRKIKKVSDANAVHLREANDKIRRLEAENAELRAQLLSQHRSKSPSTDIPLMVSGVFFKHMITNIFYPFLPYSQADNKRGNTAFCRLTRPYRC